MSYQNTFKRYELKYLITEQQMELLKELMYRYMLPDKFGKSIISNIYFDTPSKLLIRRSLEKPIYKEKLRVRSYGTATDDSTVFIELKKKYKGVVYKRRIDMTYSNAKLWLCENNSPSNRSQIINEIDYFCNFYTGIEPSVFLYYEREAYFSKTDKNFRMTFDKNILWRDYDLTLSGSAYGKPLLKPNEILLEVKSSDGFPLWLTNFLSKNQIFKTSFSKYGNAYKEMLTAAKLGGKISA